MVALLLTTTISCSDALAIIHRVLRVPNLSPEQKTEIIQVIREHVPICPIKVVSDERSKSSSR